MICALIAVIPLMASLFRQRRTAIGSGSIRLEHYGDQDPAAARHPVHSSSSFTTMASERTHLLTLKDMYASIHKEKKETKRPRGRSIIVNNPEQDPFHLVPSATFDTDNTATSKREKPIITDIETNEEESLEI